MNAPQKNESLAEGKSASPKVLADVSLHDVAQKSEPPTEERTKEALSTEEINRVSERIASVERDMRFMEKIRATTLTYNSSGSFSSLAVIIRSADDTERRSVEFNAEQMHESLSDDALKLFEEKFQKLKEDYLFEDGARYVKMTTPGEGWADQRIAIETGTIVDPERFVDELKKGNRRLKNTTMTFRGDPDPDWRYGHLFKMAEMPPAIVDGVDEAAGQ